MPTPNPLAPVKGAGTTLWIYSGTEDPLKDPFTDTDWTRLAKIKELQPGEITADSYDDTYLDDEDADWKATAQGKNQRVRPTSRWHGNRVNKVKKIWLIGSN